MKSPKWRNLYSLTGGHIELGETAEQALTREVWEETGLKINNIEFSGLQEYVFGKEFYRPKHFIFLDFNCKTNNQTVKLDGREGTSYVWVTINEALKLPLNPYTRTTILRYKRKHRR